jgi:hypothetical protein
LDGGVDGEVVFTMPLKAVECGIVNASLRLALRLLASTELAPRLPPRYGADNGRETT